MAHQNGNGGSEAAAFFDRVSGRYREKYGTGSPFHHYFFNQRLEKTLEGLDLAGKDVLDIGSGTGDLYDAVVQRWPDVRYYATDISTGMLAQSRVPAGNRFVGHACDHPFQQRHFDLITMLGVTTYMDDAELDRNLAFIANSLKEGGKAVITFTNSHALDHWLRTLAKPLLSVFGRKDKVLTNLRIHPRSAAQARALIEKHLRVQDLVLLNQTVFPFSRMLPRPALALARRIGTVPGTPAWKRWLSSDLLFRVGSS
jgi:SAM-dependent methyltransferase